MTDQPQRGDYLTCDRCRHWQPIEYGGVCHLDPERPEPTGGGYSCGSWRAQTTPAKAATVKPTRGVMTPAADGFDVEAAAERVVEAALPVISIVTVQAALRCQYRQAAVVVEWLKSTDRIKEA